MSRRTGAFLIGVAALVLAAGAGGLFLVARSDDGAETTTSGTDLRRANPTCPELGPESLDDCAGRTDTEGQVARARQRRTVDELEVGDCVNDLLYPDALVVPCAAPHQEEIVAVLVGPEGGYPGSELLVDTFAPECDSRGAEYVGRDPAADELYVQPAIPFGAAEWDAHGRKIVCSVSSIRKDLRKGSVRS
jgi:hypothetical protein